MRRENENKVLFGMKEMYIGTYTENADGTVTMGEPYHQTGAVGFSPEEQGSNYNFYADDGVYYSYYTTGRFEGDLVVARFDREFRTLFMGEIELDDGGLAMIKNAKRPNVYLAFETQGDQGPERLIFYNGSLGGITREYATIEEEVEVQTEKMPLTFTGDNTTGMTKVVYMEGDEGFETLFTNPPAPKLPESQSE